MRAWVVLIIASQLAPTGCDPTAADCKVLVKELNESVDRLRPQRVTDAGPPTEVAGAMRLFGAAVTKETDQIAAVTLEAPALVAARDAYVAAARQTAAAAIGWADAVDARHRARREGDAAKAALDRNLDELDERCRGSACFELMKRLAAPTTTPSSALHTALGALADELGGITTDDPAIDAAIAQHRIELGRLAAALKSMREAEAETDRHRQTLAGAAAVETAAVDRIDGICRP